MTYIRWIMGLPLAAIVTAGLFMMMAGFIKRDGGPLAPPRAPLDLEIFAREPVEGPETPDRPAPLTEEQPEIVIPPTLPGDKPVIQANPPTTSGVDVNIETGGSQFSTPVIKHAPAYPENCRSKAVEGSVLVQFDVTPEGNVINPQIIESADNCFNRTVIRTVSKWKYPPAYQNGKPIMRYGVVERFSFNLVE